MACHICKVLLLPSDTKYNLRDCNQITIRMQNWQYASACCQPSPSPHPTRYPIYLAMLYNNFPCPKQPVWSYISRTPISGEHYQAVLTRRRCFPLKNGITISTPHSDYPGQLILLKHGTVPLMQLLGAIILQFESL